MLSFYITRSIVSLQDSTFEFERKRNRPERYDRNHAENTVKAIKKIDKVRVDREAKHHEKRMMGNITKAKIEARIVTEHRLGQSSGLRLPYNKIDPSHRRKSRFPKSK